VRDSALVSIVTHPNRVVNTAEEIYEGTNKDECFSIKKLFNLREKILSD
jgi:hypothetical protein